MQGAPAGRHPDGKLVILDTVNFRSNKAVIQKNSFKLLDNVVEVLIGRPTMRALVEGHTDSKGSDSANLPLSQRRADAVMAYLVNKGVTADRLEAVGYGEFQPVTDNTSTIGLATDRRVVFTILGDAQGVSTTTSKPPSSDTIGRELPGRATSGQIRPSLAG